MYYEYLIQTTPSPTNPNEQPEGTTIVDDRLYGENVFRVSMSNTIYLRNDFSKDEDSNQLTLPSYVYNGTIIGVETLKQCTCE